MFSFLCFCIRLMSGLVVAASAIAGIHPGSPSKACFLFSRCYFLYVYPLCLHTVYQIARVKNNSTHTTYAWHLCGVLDQALSFHVQGVAVRRRTQSPQHSLFFCILCVNQYEAIGSEISPGRVPAVVPPPSSAASASFAISPCHVLSLCALPRRVFDT